MSLQQKYLRILSGIAPAGAAGLSLLLGAAAPGEAREHPGDLQPSAAGEPAIAERLAAIREATSTLLIPPTVKPDDGNLHLAWGNWWRNGGWRPWNNWGWPNWNNWRNWNNWNNWWRNW